MFKKLFSRGVQNDVSSRTAFDPMQAAVAALLVEAARADETFDDRERAIIDKALAAKFELTAENAAAVRAEGERIQEQATDIQRFTRIAKTMDHEEKVALIEKLWEVVLSDGERDPYEDALIRRICGLIYVSDPQSGAARSRVEARLAGR